MDKVVIFISETGGVAVLTPCNPHKAIKEIADSGVPTGRPYKIMNVADMPTDYSSFDQWTVDAADLTDGEGA